MAVVPLAEAVNKATSRASARASPTATAPRSSSSLTRLSASQCRTVSSSLAWETNGTAVRQSSLMSPRRSRARSSRLEEPSGGRLLAAARADKRSPDIADHGQQVRHTFALVAGLTSSLKPCSRARQGPHRYRPALSPPRRSRRARPPPSAAGSWTGCTPSRSTRHRPARARRVRRTDRPLRVRRRSARPASRRR